MNRTVVAARHREDIAWLAGLTDRVVLYNCGPPVAAPRNVEVFERPNVGREAGAYLKYIVDHYDDLPDHVVFTQGHPFDHSPDFLERLAHDYDGPTSLSSGYSADYPPEDRPDLIASDETVHGHRVRLGDVRTFGRSDLPAVGEEFIGHVWYQVFDCDLPERLGFGFGALWHVPRDSIVGRPKAFWRSLLDQCDELGEVAYALEAVWGAIWRPDLYPTLPVAEELRDPVIFRALGYPEPCVPPPPGPVGDPACAATATATTILLRWLQAEQTVCPPETAYYIVGTLQLRLAGIWIDIDAEITSGAWHEEVFGLVSGLSPDECYEFRVRWSGPTGTVFSGPVECCTTPTDTFGEVMSGGAVVSGAAALSGVVYDEAMAGGARLGGEAPHGSGHFASGGVRLDGSARVAARLAASVSGGVRVSGPKYLGGYTHDLMVTVPAGKASSDLSGFPLGVKAVVPAGLTVSTVAATDAIGNPIGVEFIEYDSASGRLVAFVKMAISSASPSIVHIYFGD